MVMPTVLASNPESLDYYEFTNNHVFPKSCNNGFFEYRDHGHYDPHDHYVGRKVNPAAKKLIGDALRERIENIDHEFCEPGEEDTFFVADLGEVYRQHLRWKLNLPRVKPFYGKIFYSSLTKRRMDWLLT
jgi:ornithine decarboxylase